MSSVIMAILDELRNLTAFLVWLVAVFGNRPTVLCLHLNSETKAGFTPWVADAKTHLPAFWTQNAGKCDTKPGHKISQPILT